MFFFACHSVLLCIGCMEHSDSESHASTSVSSVKKQTTITAFFMSVVLLCSGVATVPWICWCSVC